MYVLEVLITGGVSLHDPHAEGPDLQFHRQWSKAPGIGVMEVEEGYIHVEPELTLECLHAHIHVFLGEGFSSHQCLLQTATPKF